MIMRPIKFVILVLFVIIIYLAQNYTYERELKIYAINSLYSYIYDVNRYYSINFFMDEKLEKETFNYFFIQDGNKIPLLVKNISIIGNSNLLEVNYLNVAIDFYIPEPLDYFKKTKLLLENSNISYLLDIGIFTTYYQPQIKYLNYTSLNAFYDKNILGVNLGTNEDITRCEVAPFIITTLIKKYLNYQIDFTYQDRYYLYKFYLKLSIDNKTYLLECPRFQTINLELNDYYYYLNEGKRNA